jgi:hypothetical protein
MSKYIREPKNKRRQRSKTGLKKKKKKKEEVVLEICMNTVRSVVKSWRKCRRKLHMKYPDSTVLCKATIFNIVTKLCSLGSVLDKKKY